MKPDRERADDYYQKKGKSYSDYSMTKYQQNHTNKSTSDNKMRYRDDRGGGYQQSARPGSETRPTGPDSSSSHFKPPIGQASSSSAAAPRPPYNFAALQRLPLNIDNLPPRLKKKHILDLGLPEELATMSIAEVMQQYSNSSFAMGRNNRNNRFEHQNFSSNYHNNKYDNQRANFDGNHNQRSITPPPSKSMSRQSATPPKPPTQQQQRYEGAVQRRDDASQSITKSVQDDGGSGSFDWSEDVMNSQSLPYEVNANHPAKYDDSHRPRHRRRNRR